MECSKLPGKAGRRRQGPFLKCTGLAHHSTLSNLNVLCDPEHVCAFFPCSCALKDHVDALATHSASISFTQDSLDASSWLALALHSTTRSTCWNPKMRHFDVSELKHSCRWPRRRSLSILFHVLQRFKLLSVRESNSSLNTAMLTSALFRVSTWKRSSFRCWWILTQIRDLAVSSYKRLIV